MLEEIGVDIFDVGCRCFRAGDPQARIVGINPYHPLRQRSQFTCQHPGAASDVEHISGAGGNPAQYLALVMDVVVPPGGHTYPNCSSVMEGRVRRRNPRSRRLALTNFQRPRPGCSGMSTAATTPGTEKSASPSSGVSANGMGGAT